MKKFGDYIEIDGSGFEKPAYYEEEVLKVLQQISTTQVGALVLQEVRMTGHKLIIKPAKKLVDAQANPQNSHPSTKKYTTYCATPGASPLEYLPGDYIGGKIINIEPFFGPDDTLVHELVHKARLMKGVACMRPMGENYDNIEEFLAILVTNIYLSEIRKEYKLRSSASLLVVKQTMNSEDFSTKYDREISVLRDTMRGFAKSLADIKCNFNPIRAGYEYVNQTMKYWAPSSI